MKKYLYFVSYSHPTGFGNASIWTTSPVTSWDPIEIFKTQICEYRRVPASRLVILNFILLDTYDEDTDSVAARKADQ